MNGSSFVRGGVLS